MKKFNLIIRPITLIAVLIFVFLIIVLPEVCTSGAAAGIILCGRVIIPSLFPFTVCVLFVLKSGLLNKIGFIEPFTKKIFHQTPEQFFVMLLSFIGGYPIGAKLINELVKLNKISLKNAQIMLCFCVNAGPAFIVLAVGSTILHSITIGYVLLISHLLSSVIIALFFKSFIVYEKCQVKALKTPNVTDNFVISTSDAGTVVFGICGYVILFSTIKAYIEYFGSNIKELSFLKYILEVTSAISSTNNIYLISFLLGFAGICVWFQIISVSVNVKMNVILFVTSRILHGMISTIITYMILKIFNISAPTFSNNISFSGNPFYTTTALSISLVIMAIILIISLSNKNKVGNFYSDLL